MENFKVLNKKKAERRYNLDYGYVTTYSYALGASFKKSEIDALKDDAIIGVCYLDTNTGRFKLLKLFTKASLINESKNYSKHLDNPIFNEYVFKAKVNPEPHYIVYIK